MRLTARADDEVSAYVVVLGRLTMTETSKQTASGGVFLLATLAWCFSHNFLIYLGWWHETARNDAIIGTP